jgi:hypothetical protein
MNRTIAVAALLAAGSGCATHPPATALASSSPAASCAGPTPNYQTQIAPLLEHYCFGCHAPGGDAGEDHDFTRFEVLHAQRRQLGSELEAGAMPPADRPQPSRVERELLELWACLGARRN